MESRSNGRRPAPRAALALCAAAAVLAAGCAGLGRVTVEKRPVSPVRQNFVGESRLPETLRRVVLLPVWGGEAAPSESALALDPGFATALVRQKRFEVVTISREECQRRFGNDSLSSASALPAGFLDELRRDFAADGVMFVDLTAYHPIRPIALGVRAKLALTAGARIIWSFDDVYSAEDPAVLQGIRRYYGAAGGDRGEGPANLPEAALISPSRFGAYAADATFQTLPPRWR